MNNKLASIADELFLELEPTDITVGIIGFWLRNNIGKLNILIDGSYSIDNNGEFDPEINDKDKVIYKKIYEIYYWGKQMKASLGAASTDSVTEISSDGATVRRVNKTTTAQTYLQAKKNAQEDLKELLDSYSSNDVRPLQVAGDDTTVATITNLSDMNIYSRGSN